VHTRRINIFIGAYGSGKTELAVNYALKLKLKKIGQKVGLVDLDIVNPFFRSRELKTFLNGQGIEVLSTEKGLEEADLPALSPRIFAFLQDSTYQAVFDVGGDPVGARALGRYEDYFSPRTQGGAGAGAGAGVYNLWWVINPYRPGCFGSDLLLDLAGRLESTSKLKITGIIDNSNLGKETTPELRTEGARIVDETAALLNLPVVIRTTVPPLDAARALRRREQEAEIMQLKLFMVPPWENPY